NRGSDGGIHCALSAGASLDPGYSHRFFHLLVDSGLGISGILVCPSVSEWSGDIDRRDKSRDRRHCILGACGWILGWGSACQVFPAKGKELSVQQLVIIGR